MEDNLQGDQGDESLSLKENYEGVVKIKKKDGSIYSVRRSRKRYFFPDDWIKFIREFNNKQHRFFFLTAIHTGGRIMEILNLRHRDINIEREIITFNIVKERKARKDFQKDGSRSFFVASNFISEYKSFIRGKNINPNDFIFLDNSKLPSNYMELQNKERKKYFASKVISYSNMLKRKLKKAMVEDWYLYSPHNLRKTYGMWMREFKDNMEVCYRLGHDLKTYHTHYGSSSLFNDLDRRKIMKIYGDIK